MATISMAFAVPCAASRRSVSSRACASAKGLPRGMNCFACDAQAKAEFDLICEQDHGCDPIPVTRAMSGALQTTDPRCKNQQPVSEVRRTVCTLPIDASERHVLFAEPCEHVDDARRDCEFAFEEAIGSRKRGKTRPKDLRSATVAHQ
jgi:hypothetical protein